MHRYRNRSSATLGDRIECAVVRRLLHQDPVAGLHEGAEEQGDGLLGAAGHHDLILGGGESAS